MKQFNNVKSQAMFFTLFILAVFGALAGGLAVMWESEIRTRTSDRDGLIAFYLAQAGIERAKIELASNESWLGGGPFALGGGTYSITVTDIPSCPPGPYNTCRQITSTGSVTSGGSTLAERQIVAGVSLDSPPLLPNTMGDEDQLPWSWREI